MICSSLKSSFQIIGFGRFGFYFCVQLFILDDNFLVSCHVTKALTYILLILLLEDSHHCIGSCRGEWDCDLFSFLSGYNLTIIWDNGIVVYNYMQYAVCLGYPVTHPLLIDTNNRILDLMKYQSRLVVLCPGIKNKTLFKLFNCFLEN